MLHQMEPTSFGYLFWGEFFCLDFGPARASKCSLQFIVIDKIHVEIANPRDNGLHIYLHLVANGGNVRVFDEPSCLALFFGLMKPVKDARTQ